MVRRRGGGSGAADGVVAGERVGRAPRLDGRDAALRAAELDDAAPEVGVGARAARGGVGERRRGARGLQDVEERLGARERADHVAAAVAAAHARRVGGEALGGRSGAWRGVVCFGAGG